MGKKKKGKKSGSGYALIADHELSIEPEEGYRPRVLPTPHVEEVGHLLRILKFDLPECLLAIKQILPLSTDEKAKATVGLMLEDLATWSEALAEALIHGWWILPSDMPAYRPHDLLTATYVQSNRANIADADVSALRTLVARCYRNSKHARRLELGAESQA